ncbi:hypothetical protein BO94DRAFT_105846 [Aspergillus sclerotioniger CBS 115572]|uniref:Uncharacterized protein n=1 Tax=Aspergillus sclerotioniger CBS 115572 TaxID=1450535 RepID=A0A317WK68_9EURO|nr:hypothetical protein BO94DRAFT_105846 [Aspergillus sclerotioniger CBS 115572]PWY84600.1 hypothetical protein BO94DRAFT_105846 [Aspergillus sclerotioniger CBS 115572]
MVRPNNRGGSALEPVDGYRQPVSRVLATTTDSVACFRKWMDDGWMDGCMYLSSGIPHKHQTALNAPQPVPLRCHPLYSEYLHPTSIVHTLVPAKPQWIERRVPEVLFFALFGDAGTSRDCPPALAALTPVGPRAVIYSTLRLTAHLPGPEHLSLGLALYPLIHAPCPPPFRLVLVRSIRLSHLSVFSPRSRSHITPALIHPLPSESLVFLAYVFLQATPSVALCIAQPVPPFAS